MQARLTRPWQIGSGILWPSFCSRKQQQMLFQELHRALKPKRYVYEHLDGVIQGYRECLLPDNGTHLDFVWVTAASYVSMHMWKVAICIYVSHVSSFILSDFAPVTHNLVTEIKDTVSSLCDHPESSNSNIAANNSCGSSLKWLPHAHILDLLPNGSISYHKDSVAEFGSLLCSVSLGSSRRMRLRNIEDPSIVREVSIPPGSLYILMDEARYEWEHAIMAFDADKDMHDESATHAEERSNMHGDCIGTQDHQSRRGQDGRRISLILRTAK
jgi:hypothetical protein